MLSSDDTPQSLTRRAHQLIADDRLREALPLLDTQHRIRGWRRWARWGRSAPRPRWRRCSRTATPMFATPASARSPTSAPSRH